ncbi:MAG: DEAD/DEAH box helicase [Methanobrevibacter olleyae]|uniref:DEAD/DEAH box helicase n=1 Tax=Methanobrevibacter olleyae TaxID=294671 RepID=A0A8T3VRB2_METOL|nr:DEAD/DEAH box helicase [Methanobrevibacter olleyae]
MIVLSKKKKTWEMYPIGSPKGALNTKRKPEFIGVLKFKENDEDKSISINRFVVKDEKEDKLYPPSKAMNLLRSQAVFLADKDERLEAFLKQNNIKVRFTNICQHCSFEGEVTIINSDFSYLYHDQLICKTCAENTIKRELQLRGYDKKVFRNFKRVLEKTGSLDDVLEMLSPRFDPLAHTDLTLFDRVKVHDDKIPKIAMTRLKIPEEFKQVILKEKNDYLLPVQYLAIREGLLKGENLLVVSATGSGKTLVGELAGIPKALNGKKFLFLTPLVALANQKYRDFKKRYEPLGLKVAIKVGMNRIKAKGELKLPNSNIKDADIVVGTYEGIDFMLRAGDSDALNELGLVLIDEIHTISDEERGLRLNGLIKRIEHIFPKTQIIGLSATIKNPQDLANDFNMKLVQYKERPVPLERHIAFVRGDVQRGIIMRKLVQREYYSTSSKGFKGQTLIFTNSRRKTHRIANFLSGKGINASAYHAGLSYFKKEKIEKDFSKGKIAAVVTTAALAAGVDFPASQVIFESLLMGNKWITPNEFSQMLGRAGRPTYHDRGVIYLIPEIGSEFDNETEELVALELLESDVEDIFVDYTEDGSLEQILADISSKSLRKVKDVEEFYQNIPVPMDIKTALDELEDKDAIQIHADDTIDTTRFGRAVAMSFLSVDDGVIIKDSINDPNYLSYYYKKPFFKTNLKELSLLSEKIDEDNENALKKNKKIRNRSKSKDSSKNNKDKKDKKESKERDKKDKKDKKVKKDNKKKNKTKTDKKNKNKSHKSKDNKIKEKSIKPKEDKPKESHDNESSGIKFIVEENVDEKPVPKKETKKESKTSMYIDNIADYFNGLNQSKDYKSSNNKDSPSSNKKNDYKSSKKDNKSDVIYNKKTSNKSKSKKNKKSVAVREIKFKENIFADIHEKMTKGEVNSNYLLKVQSIALDLELFENAYLAPVVHKQIISALKMNFSTRLFAESTLDIISSGEAISKIDKKFQDALLKIQIDFLRCDCNERPFCECLQRGISYYIINQRLNGKDPIDISNSLLKEYQIQTYPGDIFSWLDAYVRNLDAIRRIAKAFGQKDIVQVSEKLMKIVESGK